MSDSPTPSGRGHPAWVLGVLMIVYVFNFLDRQIVSILAERIKADLGLSDAQLGFLYGTAFAVFFAVFGIPLGRLADVWDRRRLIAIGLAAWSLMTAVSGLARTFPQLAAARIGVGVGEASASPAAFSLLSDLFPAARRASVLALYSSGIYIGAGIGVGMGGLIADRWDAVWAGATAPLGLRGWQVAFLVVGLPGLLLALVVNRLEEPPRGAAEGLPTPVMPRPLPEFLRELGAVVPPFTLLHLWLAGAGPRTLARNLLTAATVAAAAAALVRALGDPAQWIALAIGVYAAVSWAQSLALRDRASFTLVFKTPALRYAAVGFALLAFTSYAVGFWAPSFFVRQHGVPLAQAGLILGGTAAVGGWLGTVLGGVLGDRWQRRSPLGRLRVGLLTALLPLPLAVWMLTTDSTALAYLLIFPLTILTSMWIGPGASTVQDLVLPRLRATASATYLLVLTFIGLALGPYTIGRLSVAVGDLRTALLLGLGVNGLAACFVLLAMVHLEGDLASRLARARAAGEPDLPPEIVPARS